jgi:hypothetical protein
MTSTFIVELPVFNKRFSAKLTSPNSQKRTRLTSSFYDCRISDETAVKKNRGAWFNKICSFRYFPAFSLLSNYEHKPGRHLTATTNMAYSLNLPFITSKSIIL